MERKIGEIFEYNGEWLQCVEQPEKYVRRFVPSVLFKVMEIVNLTGVVELIEVIRSLLSSRNLKRSESLMNLMGIYFNHTVHLKCLYSQKIMRLLDN